MKVCDVCATFGDHQPENPLPADWTLILAALPDQDGSEDQGVGPAVANSWRLCNPHYSRCADVIYTLLQH